MILKEHQTWLKIIAGKQLKEQFKDLCWARGETMTERILEFMEAELKANEKLLEEVKNLRSE